MQIASDLDFETAIRIRRLINLGATIRDLSDLLPEYFGAEKFSAKAKATRAYKSLLPQNMKTPKKERAILFSTLIKSRGTHKLVSNFGLICLSAIRSAKDEDNHVDVFATLYKAWVNEFEDTPLEPNLTFQKAFSIFKYVLNNNENPYFSLVKNCKSCESNYLFFDLYRGKEFCPYCEKTA